MKTFRSLLVALGMALAAGEAGAHEIRAGSLTVEHPWARATATAQETGAVYMIIHNRGDAADRLLGASSSEAETVALHESAVSADGVARMGEAHGIEVPAGGEVRLAPGGLHVMLTGMKTQLFEGITFPLTLEFERAGEVPVEVEVQGAAAPTEHGGAGGHAEGEHHH